MSEEDCDVDSVGISTSVSLPNTPSPKSPLRVAVESYTSMSSPRSVFPRVRGQTSPVISKDVFFYPWDIPSIFVSYSNTVGVIEEDVSAVHRVSLHAQQRVLNGLFYSIIKNDFHTCGCVMMECRDSDSFRKLSSICTWVTHTHDFVQQPYSVSKMLKTLLPHPAFYNSVAVALQSLRTSRAYGTDFSLSNTAAIVQSSFVAGGFGGTWRTCLFHDFDDIPVHTLKPNIGCPSFQGAPLAHLGGYRKEECIGDCLMMLLTLRSQEPACPIQNIQADCPLFLKTSVWLFLTVRLLQPIQKNNWSDIFLADQLEQQSLVTRTDTAIRRLISLYTEGTKHIMDDNSNNDSKHDDINTNNNSDNNDNSNKSNNRNIHHIIFQTTDTSPLHDEQASSLVTPSTPTASILKATSTKTVYSLGVYQQKKHTYVQGAVLHQFQQCNSQLHKTATSHTCIFRNIEQKKDFYTWTELFPELNNTNLDDAIAGYREFQSVAGVQLQSRAQLYQQCFDQQITVQQTNVAYISEELIYTSAVAITLAVMQLRIVQARYALQTQGLTSMSMSGEHAAQCHCAQRGQMFLEVSLRTVREDVHKTMCTMYVNVEDAVKRYVWHQAYLKRRNVNEVLELRPAIEEVATDVSDAMQYFIRGDLGQLPSLQVHTKNEEDPDLSDTIHQTSMYNEDSNGYLEDSYSEGYGAGGEEIIINDKDEENIPEFLDQLREELLANIEDTQYNQLLHSLFTSFSMLLASAVPHEDVNAHVAICYCGLHTNTTENTCTNCGFIFHTDVEEVVPEEPDELVQPMVEIDLPESFIRVNSEGLPSPTVEEELDTSSDSEDQTDPKASLIKGLKWIKKYGDKISLVLKRSTKQYKDRSTELTDLAK